MAVLCACIGRLLTRCSVSLKKVPASEPGFVLRHADTAERRPGGGGLPFTTATLTNGQKKILRTSFTPSQADIDMLHPKGRPCLRGKVTRLADSGLMILAGRSACLAARRTGG